MQNNTIPSWNLGDLYLSGNDPRLESDLQRCADLAHKFGENYKGKICAESLNAEYLCSAFSEYLDLLTPLYRIESYADLLFSADTSKPENGALMQKCSERCSQISTELIFFDLELGRISDAKWQELKDATCLAQYRHYIEQARLQHRYTLSEAEETIAEEMANCGGRAFNRLFTETVSRLKFPLEVDGQVKELTQSELLAYSYNPDRELRRRAAVSLSETLEKNIHPLHFAYSTLILEKLTMDRLRGFQYPEQARHLGNELPAQAIDTMVEVVVKNYPLVARYYELKRQLLDVGTLYHYDRYAPLPTKRPENIEFPEAQETVLTAFQEFHPRFREIAQRFFDNNWIDAQLRPGKCDGAFCAGITPQDHPYILLNFTGNTRDVTTLAHELGHGIHDCLSSKQNLLNYHAVLPLAETASTFAEMLVYDKLLQKLPDSASKLSLVADNLESIFATVFRQVAMYRFEQRVFRLRKEQGELSYEQMSDIWQECLQEMFGTSVTLGPEHRITWSYIPHFISTPFYVYAYAFGELLVLALYARYKREGQAFQEKYFELLESGGSLTPQEMLAKLDIDITQADFWQSGCDLIAKDIEEAEFLAADMCYGGDDNGDEIDADSGWGEGDQDGWDGFGEE